MARESISFPESWMAEIIEFIEAGVQEYGTNMAPDVVELFTEFCDENRNYANDWDRRNASK